MEHLDRPKGKPFLSRKILRGVFYLKGESMTENIVGHEEVKIISVRPVYTVGKDPTLTITYRIKSDSMKIRPGDVVTLLKNPVRQKTAVVDSPEKG